MKLEDLCLNEIPTIGLYSITNKDKTIEEEVGIIVFNENKIIKTYPSKEVKEYNKHEQNIKKYFSEEAKEFMKNEPFKFISSDKGITYRNIPKRGSDLSIKRSDEKFLEYAFEILYD